MELQPEFDVEGFKAKVAAADRKELGELLFVLGQEIAAKTSGINRYAAIALETIVRVAGNDAIPAEDRLHSVKLLAATALKGPD